MPKVKNILASVPVGTVVSTTQVSARTRRNRRRRQRRRAARNQLVSSTNGNAGNRRTTRRNISGNMSNFASAAYVNCLNDPFNNPPTRIGLGTMIPTDCESAYSRNSFTLNADGSGTLVFIPQLIVGGNSANGGAFISINNLATGTVPTWATQFNATNATQLAADFDQYRMLAAAIRILPLQAQTAIPGVMNAGVVAPDSNRMVPGGVQMNNQTTTTYATYPELETFMGYEPIQVIWRPSEIADFDFIPPKTGGNGTTSPATTQDTNGPVIMVTFSGFPASTIVYFEAVSHVEGYASTKLVGLNVVGEQPTSVASEQPSIDSLWQYAAKRLGPTVVSLGSYLASKGIDYVTGGVRQLLFPQSNLIRRIAQRPGVLRSTNKRVSLTVSSTDDEIDEKQFSNISSPVNVNSPIPQRIPIRKVRT